MKVRCNQCGWQGDEEELVIAYNPTPNKIDISSMEHCPNCNETECLMDLKPERYEKTLVK
jgi:NAD-dependent SIR2 family protein deacetylase